MMIHHMTNASQLSYNDQFVAIRSQHSLQSRASPLSSLGIFYDNLLQSNGDGNVNDFCL